MLIGTPGRVVALVRDKEQKPKKLTHFVLDEYDKCLEKFDIRGDILRSSWRPRRRSR